MINSQFPLTLMELEQALRHGGIACHLVYIENNLACLKLNCEAYTVGIEPVVIEAERIR